MRLVVVVRRAMVRRQEILGVARNGTFHETVVVGAWLDCKRRRNVCVYAACESVKSVGRRTESERERERQISRFVLFSVVSLAHGKARCWTKLQSHVKFNQILSL